MRPDPVLAGPVLTLTLNPAVDVSTSTARIEPSHKLRCAAPRVDPGGGGLNVARVLHRLGTDVRALYAAGGVTGDLLQRLLRAEGLREQRIVVAGETRERFSVREESSGREYRFVLPGAALAEAEWQACLDACLAADARCVVASGSLPPGVPEDFHARLARRLALAGKVLVLDTAGAPLAAALEAGVHIVKPSLRELRDLTGDALADEAAQLAACRALVRRGAANIVALSLGEQGALLVTREAAWRAPALDVPVVGTTGAGDSFVGGLVAALVVGEALDGALRWAMAASAAALLEPGTALAAAADVARLLPQVRIDPRG